jgi:S-adenosyl-L-methionine hydrolase (adenosine-forming)
MKAVLARSIDPGRLVDLAHDLPAHAIEEAAFVVRAMARGFPAGSIHVVVVDPGVGGSRLPIALACRDGSVVVGPDNGVLYPLADALGRPTAYRIDPARLGHARVGTTFDGRDVFAPAAALLADGASPARLGPRIVPRAYRLPAPTARAGALEGVVVHVDRFGNLITNLPSDTIPPGVPSFLVTIGRRRRRLPIATSYEALGPGRLGLLRSSFGTLELAVARARAADRLRAGVGTAVQLHRARSAAPRTATVIIGRPR